MYWNYRLMKSDEEDGDEPMIYITEVFYEKDDSVIGWVHPSDYGNQYASTTEELRHSFEDMLLAFDKPVLIEKDLPGYVDGRDLV